MDEKYEEKIISLILNGGNARSLALKAIDEAQAGNILESQQLMWEANEAVGEAHNIQTQLIEAEMVSSMSQPVNLLMVHAQDHLMNAITVIDLASKFIHLYSEKKVEG